MSNGNAYVFMKKGAKKATKVLDGDAFADRRCMIISRRHPSQLGIERGDNIERYWLASEFGRNVLDPQNLGLLTDTIINFLSGVEDGFLLLEGLDYLTVMNGFDNVMKMIYRVTEATVLHGGIVLVTLDPDAFGTRERALLGSELRSVDLEL